MIIISYVYHRVCVLIGALVITDARNVKKLLWEMQQARQKCVLYGQLTLIKLICWEILSLWNYGAIPVCEFCLKKKKKYQLSLKQWILQRYRGQDCCISLRFINK